MAVESRRVAVQLPFPFCSARQSDPLQGDVGDSLLIDDVIIDDVKRSVDEVVSSSGGTIMFPCFESNKIYPG